MKYIITLLSLMIVGCAPIKTSGVMPSENGTNLVTVEVNMFRGGIAGANEAAYQKAQTYCSSQGSKAIVVSSQNSDTSRGNININNSTDLNAAITMRFRCAK